MWSPSSSTRSAQSPTAGTASLWLWHPNSVIIPSPLHRPPHATYNSDTWAARCGYRVGQIGSEWVNFQIRLQNSFARNLTNFRAKLDPLTGMSNLTSKLGQIGPKWDTSEMSQNTLKQILESPRFLPFGANLIQFGCQIWHPGSLGDITASLRAASLVTHWTNIGTNQWLLAYTMLVGL